MQKVFKISKIFFLSDKILVKNCQKYFKLFKIYQKWALYFYKEEKFYNFKLNFEAVRGRGGQMRGQIWTPRPQKPLSRPFICPNRAYLRNGLEAGNFISPDLCSQWSNWSPIWQI